MLSRRAFLFRTAAVAVVPLLPVPFAIGEDPFYFDYTTRTIKWIGPEAPYSVFDFYKYLSKQLEDDSGPAPDFTVSNADMTLNTIMTIN